MARRAANDRNLLSSRTLRPLDLSILQIPTPKLRSQISLSQWAVSNLYRLLALYPKTERVSNERPFSPGSRGRGPGCSFPRFLQRKREPPTGSDPHGVGYSESLACMTGTTSRCWEQRLFLTNVVSHRRSHPPAARRSVVGFCRRLLRLRRWPVAAAAFETGVVRFRLTPRTRPRSRSP